MTSLRKVLGGRFVLGVAFWACACQRDSVASFDDSQLPDPFKGGTQGAAGSLAIAGDNAAGGNASAGSSSEAGGKAAAGNAGAGKGGEGSVGGMPTAGSAGKPGTAGEGGSSGSAVAGGGSGGFGGTEPDPEPEPVTLTTQDFADTHVASCLNFNYGEAQTLNVDGDNNCVYQTLLNPSLADVPDGALVSKATLTLYCVNAGDSVTVSYVDEAWQEDTVRWSTRPESGTDLTDFTCEELGAVSLDITAAVNAWVSGAKAANGLRFSTASTDGTDFTSSESQNVGERPTLSVTYTLPK